MYLCEDVFNFDFEQNCICIWLIPFTFVKIVFVFELNWGTSCRCLAYTVEKHWCRHEIHRLVALDGGLRPYLLRFHVKQAGADAKLIQHGPLGFAYHRRDPISTVPVARITAHAKVPGFYICLYFSFLVHSNMSNPRNPKKKSKFWK